jgi:hypothetical protein
MGSYRFDRLFQNDKAKNRGRYAFAAYFTKSRRLIREILFDSASMLDYIIGYQVFESDSLNRSLPGFIEDLGNLGAIISGGGINTGIRHSNRRESIRTYAFSYLRDRVSPGPPMMEGL